MNKTIDLAHTLERVKVMLDEQCAAAFHVFNVLSFMAQALPDDKQGELPTRSVIFNLRDQQEKLAMELGDMAMNAERQQGERVHE